ncbi:phage tail length tape measure family protein [Ectopseudomonas khazarica]|uniref:phage tail length tape measure family protein n=1 Tax=Ectopseudomonas khazarica TaxID=2502979 RepID=UPI003B936095
MVDIASLGFSIDTSDVSRAEAALDGLNNAGAKTEAAAKGVGTAWGGAAKKASGTAGEFQKGTDAIRQQQDALANLLGRIDPVIKKLGDLDSMEKELRNFRLAGVVELESFNEYQNKIDLSRRSLTAFDDVLFGTGRTSKQTAQALRQLPAQFSDIFISLQAGQSPLTVFLQQGSQIKDSFGGAGPALRETARYALGLVNPFTLAAVAIGAAALAYKQGSDEITAYQRSLILTGNAAGTTAGQLSDMAKTIDGTVGTQRQAAAALAEVAGTGKFAADQIQAVATAAVAMEEATGKAVSETIAEFKKLAEEPAAASAKLNEQYNYLTASVYAQIAALEAQGDAVGAQELAIETFGDAMERRANQIEGNLGLIEQAWKGIKNVASEAWDEMLGIGRESTLQDQLEQLRRARVEAAYGPRGDRAAPSLTASQSSRFDAEEQRLLLGIQSEGLDAATEGLRAENQKRAIEGLELIGKEADSARSNVEKLRERLKELNDARDFNIANRSFTPEAQSQFEKSTAALNKQIADAEERANRPARAPRQAAFRDDAATVMLQQLRAQAASLHEQLSTTEKLTSAQQQQIKFTQLIADLKGKDILTAEQKSLLGNEEIIKAQLQQNVALDAEIIKREELAKLAQEQAQAQERVNREAFRIADSLKTEEEQILASYERRRDIILRNTEITGQAQAELLRRLEDERNDDLLKSSGSYWEKWLVSAEESLTNFDELAGATVENFSGRFGEAFESMIFDAQSLGDAFTGLWEGVARAAVAALGEMAAQWLAYQAVQLLVGKSTQASAATALGANASAAAIQSGINAFSSTAAIPIVGPALAPGAMAAALAVTVPMAASVQALALAGMAHDGIDEIPKAGTWLLDRGERVVDSRTNADLKQYLARQEQYLAIDQPGRFGGMDSASQAAGRGGSAVGSGPMFGPITMNFPSVKDERTAKESSMAMRRQMLGLMNDAQRAG